MYIKGRGYPWAGRYGLQRPKGPVTIMIFSVGGKDLNAGT